MNVAIPRAASNRARRVCPQNQSSAEEELSLSKCFPGFIQKQTSLDTVGMSQMCQFRTHAQQQLRSIRHLVARRLSIGCGITGLSATTARQTSTVMLEIGVNKILRSSASKSSCCQLENSRRASNPPPSRLASVSVPRSALASCWAMASPSPVPPVSRLREASIR
jgi:hypothetical protein